MNEVKTFKLKSGEEFMAEVTESNDDFVMVKHPVVLIQQGESMSFTPWIATSKVVDYSVPVDMILFSSSPLDQLVDAYNAQFNPSAIVVPPLQIITG